VDYGEAQAVLLGSGRRAWRWVSEPIAAQPANQARVVA